MTIDSGEMTGGHNGGIAEGTFAQFLSDTVPIKMIRNK